MSYPETLVWGTGAPKFYIGELPGEGERIIRQVDDGEGYSAESITLPAAADIDIQFPPARNDSGDVELILENGNSLMREDGYRLALTISWTGLNASNFAKILRIANATRRYKVYVQPHLDVALIYAVGVMRLQHALTGGLYVAHDVVAMITGADILSEVPTISNATDLYPLIGLR